MTIFDIRNDVPIPPLKGKGTTVYPFKKMEVGDSFTGPRGATIAAAYYKKRHIWDYTSRKLQDGTYRIWRTA